MVADHLLRAHIVRRAGNFVALAKGAGGGDAKVDDLRQGAAIHFIHQQVARLEVTVDHAFLVGVLHAGADLNEQSNARLKRKCVLVTVVGNRAAADELHGEVGVAVRRGAGVKNLRDGGVAHMRQQLTL